MVSGAVTPDSCTVDKVSRAILERKTGAKETSVWLAADGGTYEQPAVARERPCLTDAQVLQLTEMLIQVEDYYVKPIDFEWAFAGGKLYLLQARPITAYVPLPEAIQTAPGEPKRLYLDKSLIVEGLDKPMSVMGTDYTDFLDAALVKHWYGEGFSGMDGLGFSLEGRIYVNASYMIKVMGKQRFANSYRAMDVLTSEIIKHVDESEYVPQHLPRNLKGAMVKMLLRNLAGIGRAMRALLNPTAVKESLYREADQFHQDVAWEAKQAKTRSIRAFAERTLDRYGRHLKYSWAMVLASEIARSRIKNPFPG